MIASQMLQGEFEKQISKGKAPTNSRALNLAVIGGGLSGLAALYEIYSRLDEFLESGQRMSITIYDPHGFDGRGIPYAPPHDKPPEMIRAWKKLTLNVLAGMMLDEPKHNINFHRWLEDKGHGFTPESFVPRYIFGAYLEELAQKITAAIADDPRVQLHVRKEKVNTATQALGYIVLGAGAERHAYDHVFLATGHIRTMQLNQLEGMPGYFRTPYNFSVPNMQPRGNAEKEMILWGGESSIIDGYMIMEEMGYTGKYTIITRAAEALRTKRAGIGMPLTPGYERFCRMRDYESARVEIIDGFVHDTEIARSPYGEEFIVPTTIMRFQDDEAIELTAANLMNVSLWEYKPTITGGYFYSPTDAKVYSLQTGIPCTDLLSAMHETKLIAFDPDDRMIRTHSAQLSIIGSPLMVGRKDMEVRAWSADNSWDTAADAVEDFVKKRTAQKTFHAAPMAHC